MVAMFRPPVLPPSLGMSRISGAEAEPSHEAFVTQYRIVCRRRSAGKVVCSSHARHAFAACVWGSALGTKVGARPALTFNNADVEIVL